MERKILSAVLLSFLLTLAISLVTASSFNQIPAITFTQGKNSTTITISPTSGFNVSNPIDVRIITSTIALEDTSVSISANPDTFYNWNSSNTTTISYTPAINYRHLKLGRIYTGNLLIKNLNDSSDNITVPINIKRSFCEYGVAGDNLSIIDIDIRNPGDDKEWEPLDETEIKVKVKNEGSKKIRNVNVEIAVIDSEGEDVTSDFNFNDEVIDLGSIDDGNSENAIFKIDELPADIEDGNYKIFVKAYVEDEEDENCAEDFDEISISREDDRAVIIRNYPFELQGKAGENLIVEFDVYNIGNEDEDDVLVTLENPELNIKEVQHLSYVDVGEKKHVVFSLTLPKQATAKEYTLKAYTYFDYDEGDINKEESYDRNSLDDLDKTYSIKLKLEPEPVKSAKITATLEPADQEVKAGKEVTIKTTITNDGEASTNYIVTLEGIENFAVEKSLAPRTFNLAPGESRDVYITLQLNEDAEGEYTFDIKASFDGKETKQPVSLTIEEEAPGIGISGSTIVENFKENWFIWAIVIVNIILIIAIIIVAVRVSRT